MFLREFKKAKIVMNKYCFYNVEIRMFEIKYKKMMYFYSKLEKCYLK